MSKVVERTAREVKLSNATYLASPHTGLWLTLRKARKVRGSKLIEFEGVSAYGRTETFKVDPDRVMCIK